MRDHGNVCTPLLLLNVKYSTRFLHEFRENVELGKYRKFSCVLLSHRNYTIHSVSHIYVCGKTHRNIHGRDSATIMNFFFVSMTSMKRSMSCPSGRNSIYFLFPTHIHAGGRGRKAKCTDASMVYMTMSVVCDIYMN